MFDSQRVQQILLNLLSNAIKFSRSDQVVRIGANQKHISLTKTMIVIWVQDQGIGIPPADQVNLFTPFYRVKTKEAKTMNLNGNGLGLSICKRICKHMGGDIEVESLQGIGSTFTYTILADNPPQNQDPLD